MGNPVSEPDFLHAFPPPRPPLPGKDSRARMSVRQKTASSIFVTGCVRLFASAFVELGAAFLTVMTGHDPFGCFPSDMTLIPPRGAFAGLVVASAGLVGGA
jgi:hypothetical protein